MTVKELIEKLSTLPEEAIVECLSEVERSWETCTVWTELTEDSIYLIDFRDKKGCMNAGKAIVEIGDK